VLAFGSSNSATACWISLAFLPVNLRRQKSNTLEIMAFLLGDGAGCGPICRSYTIGNKTAEDVGKKSGGMIAQTVEKMNENDGKCAKQLQSY
jgi:hypothetical protein